MNINKAAAFALFSGLASVPAAGAGAALEFAYLSGAISVDRFPCSRAQSKEIEGAIAKARQAQSEAIRLSHVFPSVDPISDQKAEEIFEKLDHYDAFCSLREEVSWYGQTLEFVGPDLKRGASYSHYAFKDSCKLGATVVHETAHMVTGWVHDEASLNLSSPADGIYSLGLSTEMACRELGKTSQ